MGRLVGGRNRRVDRMTEEDSTMWRTRPEGGTGMGHRLEHRFWSPPAPSQHCGSGQSLTTAGLWFPHV